MSEISVLTWSFVKFRFLYDAILFASVCPQFFLTIWGEKDGDDAICPNNWAKMGDPPMVLFYP